MLETGWFTDFLLCRILTRAASPCLLFRPTMLPALFNRVCGGYRRLCQPFPLHGVWLGPRLLWRLTSVRWRHAYDKLVLFSDVQRIEDTATIAALHLAFSAVGGMNPLRRTP